MEEIQEMNNIEEEQKSTEDHAVGEVTLEQFKNAIESNLEIKGYYDSVVDKTVNKRLDKSIESWKEKNLNQLIEEEINKRYPQKSKIEIELEEAIAAKRQLELQVQYQTLMNENNLPLSILEFVAGKDVEDTVKKSKDLILYLVNLLKNIGKNGLTSGFQGDVIHLLDQMERASLLLLIFGNL